MIKLQNHHESVIFPYFLLECERNQLTLHTTNLEREERDNEGGWREGGRRQMVSEAVVDSGQ